MSIIFKDAFYYFDETKYYDKVLNKIGTKKIDVNLIKHFFRDILKQYNNLYSISAAIEKHLTSKRNKKLFLSYTKSLLILEENFSLSMNFKLFQDTFDEKVPVNNRNNRNNRNNSNNRNNRNTPQDIRSIYVFFNQIKAFIDKIHRHEIDEDFNRHQSELVIYYILFEKYSSTKAISDKLKNQLPNLKSILKEFINEFSEYSERASTDYKKCQVFFKNKEGTRKKFVRENIVFILILNYQNIFKCMECIHDLISKLQSQMGMKSDSVDKVIANMTTSNGSRNVKNKLEQDILKLL
jgi:hypothetical protein